MLKQVIWICFFFSISLYAHPHIFATVSLSIEFEPSGEMIVKNRWAFDELYSAAKLDVIDLNQDGKINSKEWLEVERTVVQSAKQYNYYNYLLVGSKFMASENYSNYEAKKEGSLLVLSFDLHYNLNLQNEYTIVTLAVKDLSNYINMSVDMNNVKVQAPSNIEVEYFVDVLKGLTLYKAFPPTTEALFLRYRKK